MNRTGRHTGLVHNHKLKTSAFPMGTMLRPIAFSGFRVPRSLSGGRGVHCDFETGMLRALLHGGTTRFWPATTPSNWTPIRFSGSAQLLWHLGQRVHFPLSCRLPRGSTMYDTLRRVQFMASSFSMWVEQQLLMQECWCLIFLWVYNKCHQLKVPYVWNCHFAPLNSACGSCFFDVAHSSFACCTET